jgi:hypothetical protein
MTARSGVEYTRRPIAECDADTLERELVQDFVAGVHTPLARFIPAITRIAELRHIDQDRVYQDIRAEALALGAPTSRVIP